MQIVATDTTDGKIFKKYLMLGKLIKFWGKKTKLCYILNQKLISCELNDIY